MEKSPSPFASEEAKGIICNADIHVGEVRQFCQLQPEGQSLMRSAMSELNLSARAYHRSLKLSRMIADIAGSEEIQSSHLSETLQYRPKIMMGLTKFEDSNYLAVLRRITGATSVAISQSFERPYDKAVLRCRSTP